jgi:hypothetical protein
MVRLLGENNGVAEAVKNRTVVRGRTPKAANGEVAPAPYPRMPEDERSSFEDDSSDSSSSDKSSDDNNNNTNNDTADETGFSSAVEGEGEGSHNVGYVNSNRMMKNHANTASASSSSHNNNNNKIHDAHEAVLPTFDIPSQSAASTTAQNNGNTNNESLFADVDVDTKEGNADNGYDHILKQLQQVNKVSTSIQPAGSAPLLDESDAAGEGAAESMEHAIAFDDSDAEDGTASSSAADADAAATSSSYYVEETAWRLHNCGANALTGTLDPLPLAQPVPSPPKNSKTWTFCSSTRVMFGDFRNTTSIITDEDKAFLLKCMERDDFTVITEGWANGLNPNLWNLSYIKSTVGDEFYHRFRVFSRELNKEYISATAHPTENGTSHHDSVHPQAQPQSQLAECHMNVSFKELHFSLAMSLSDYIRYLDQRKFQLDQIATRRLAAGLDAHNPATREEDNKYRVESDETFTYPNPKGKAASLNCVDVVLYMIDYDLVKLLPKLHQDLVEKFTCPDLLPGGEHCMMHEVTSAGRPFMGPNFYVTPPASFTHFHQDGHGTVDSGHLCLSGYNEVIMLRRLPESHKKHAIFLLNNQRPTFYDALYGLPHADEEKEFPQWPSCKDVQHCEAMK